MKRFYTDVTAAENGDGTYQIQLDGKPVKTPLENVLTTPWQPLADAVIQEWDAQEGKIDPRTMPMTQLLNVEIDMARPGKKRSEIEAEVLKFIESDLVCYEAYHPEKLRACQLKAWEPVRQIFEEETGVRLNVTRHISFAEQPKAIKEAGNTFVKELPPSKFTAFQALVAPLGSFLIAKAYVEGHITKDEACEAAMVDEIYQADDWGEDEEVVSKREALKKELASVGRYLELSQYWAVRKQNR